MTDTTEGGEMEPPMTDFGVDLEAGVIRVGLLSDLSGAFQALVNPVVSGYQTQVDAINAAGGIHGLMIEPVVRDTGYSIDTHVQLYEEIRDEVVALGHSTGSPHSVAIKDQLAEDSMLAIPLTWYSGWSDPALNANLIPHGTPYCIEAMNVIEYLVNQNPDATSIAIASQAGDFGEDSAEGAKLAAEALGLTVVYDGQAQIVPGDDASYAEVATEIIGSGANLIWVTTGPGAYASIYGQSLAGGVQAAWSGSFVAWNAAFIAEGSAIRDGVAAQWTFGLPIAPWSADTPGTKAAIELLTAENPDIVPYEYYLEGVGEAILMEKILNAAYESGDMTRAGVLAAGKALESVSWDGLWPDQNYTGSPNEAVQRLVNIVRPSVADLEAGGSGLEVLEENYTSDIAAAFEFNETCFDAFG
jgi:ABC-type branched-subunit amino acid transport system substrate-binding protein